MNEEHLNMQIRKFLKKVGVQSQREIENAVQSGMENGSVSTGDTLKAKVRLTVTGLDLDVTIDGEIEIQ
jgi:hypothetical protein